MPKHIEAEGGELLIRTSKGGMAIVPKNMADWVKEHIASGNHSVIDHYVKNLKEVTHEAKAEKGVKIKPPVKEIVIDRTEVVRPAMPMLGSPKPSLSEPISAIPMTPLIGGVRVMKKVFEKKK